jgi:hypothetical protein
MKIKPNKQLQKRLTQIVLITILPMLTISFILPQPTYGIQRPGHIQRRRISRPFGFQESKVGVKLEQDLHQERMIPRR